MPTTSPPDRDTPPGRDTLSPGSMLDILVVDDSEANLLAIEAAVGDLTPQLVTARCGEEALRLLLERDFSLILLDVDMPGLDGLETARLIRSREKSRTIPIIFVTAFEHTDEEVRRANELGAVDYLFKPIVTEVLRAKVNTFVELRRSAERLRELERETFEQRLAQEQQSWRAQALERQMEELEEAHRQKNEFLAMLGHELRNPLAPVLASLELMSTIGLEDPKLASARDAAERQVRHLMRLVDGLLDIARVERGKLALQPSREDLRAVIAQAVDAAVTPAVDKHQEVRVHTPPKPVWADVDPVRLVQVVGNLINNAVRYSDAGTQIAVSLAVDGEQAVIDVSDDGMGIAPERLDEVFDAFVQGSPHGQGLGLGLALVKKLVELHDGEVRAFSEGEGRGSRFTIRIPTCEAPTTPESSEIAPRSSVRREGNKPRVLIVDDEDDIRMTIQALLEAQGFEVHAASDGEQALEAVRRHRPHVAIVDIGLPKMTGTEVARCICTEHAGQRPYLVAVTGYGQESHRREALAAGFDEHLVKPASLDDLTAAIDHGLDAKRTT